MHDHCMEATTFVQTFRNPCKFENGVVLCNFGLNKSQNQQFFPIARKILCDTNHFEIVLAIF